MVIVLSSIARANEHWWRNEVNVGVGYEYGVVGVGVASIVEEYHVTYTPNFKFTKSDANDSFGPGQEDVWR